MDRAIAAMALAGRAAYNKSYDAGRCRKQDRAARETRGGFVGEMEMTLRWYGSQFDTVSLQQIRQIPGVTGVITTLYDTAPGDVWSRERIRALKEEVEAAGLHIAGIESVNVHDAIKAGTPERDKYIDAYIETLENLGKEDLHLVCYNFMPVFDWTRTELARVRADGSTVLAYTQEAVDALDPETMFASIAGDANGSVMPGWEPDRMEHIRELFDLYRDIDDEKLFENLQYFLEKIMPVCNEYDIKMAIHPDDPAWSVFGLPRIIINQKNILRMMNMVDDVHNGVTFCSGSYGTNLENDLVQMIHALKGRIHFAHVRNLKFISPTNFEEAAHLSSDGSFDMYEIMKALYETGFEGPIRPDHGRMIWGEKAMPGYGLYDRALGAAYLNGLWEAIVKGEERR
ncbi:MAG: mannonate dehydratase [Bacteroidales bacterium]|nr:mannonate dehydratase [Bacteroidales bacterium]